MSKEPEGRSFRKEIQDYLGSREDLSPVPSIDTEAMTAEQPQTPGGQLEASISEDVHPDDVPPTIPPRA